jgi:phosphatidate cytidylyltransferase
VPGPAEASAPRKTTWSDLRTRVLSAALLAPLGLICIWVGHWAWGALVALAALGMAREWVGLCRAALSSFAGLAVVVLTFAAVVVAVFGRPDLALAIVVIGWIAVWAVARRPALPAGIPYVGLGGIALVWLRSDAAVGFGNVLFVILLVWASDIGAYVVGRMVGGPKLAPRISPGKTRSGAVGGLASSMLIGAIVCLVLGGPVWWAALVAGLLGVVSQAGDLLESAVKRHFGVKDSGGLIPGHGGLLDRLDGVLAAAPVAGLIALALGSGVHLWR